MSHRFNPKHAYTGARYRIYTCTYTELRERHKSIVPNPLDLRKSLLLIITAAAGTLFQTSMVGDKMGVPVEPGKCPHIT